MRQADFQTEISTGAPEWSIVRGLEGQFRAVIHKPSSEFYLVHLLVRVGKPRGEVGYHYLREGVKVDFVER